MKKLWVTATENVSTLIIFISLWFYLLWRSILFVCQLDIILCVYIFLVFIYLLFLMVKGYPWCKCLFPSGTDKNCTKSTVAWRWWHQWDIAVQSELMWFHQNSGLQRDDFNCLDSFPNCWGKFQFSWSRSYASTKYLSQVYQLNV